MCPEHQVRAGILGSSLHSKGYKALTRLLIKARAEAGLTQQQVADRLGKHQSFVAKYELGERRLDVVEMISVCKALDADPQLLFDMLIADLSR